MLRMVAAERRRARSRPPRSPPSRVTPALSMAMSLPVPMAIPTSARARAGASFTPSPVMATTRPCRISRDTASALPSGRTSASDLVDAELDPAMACAVARLSPVSMTTRSPAALKASTTGGTVGSYPVGHTENTRDPSIDRDQHGRGTSMAELVRRIRECLRTDAAVVEKALRADQDRPAADLARDPRALPGHQSPRPR